MNDSWINLSLLDIAMPTGTNSLSQALLDRFHEQFCSNPVFHVAMDTISRNGITSAIINRDLPFDTYHVYSELIEPEAKAANQKASGRCWLFAACNVLRLKIMKKYKLEEFEFSEAYLFWFDKLEKSNLFLDNIIKTADKDLDGRLMQHLLKGPVQDGGQWDMAVNLINKYGLVPKSFYPESAQSSNSLMLDWLLTAKLRDFAKRLRSLHKQDKSLDELYENKNIMLGEIYNILSITLGVPPKKFDWEFRDKDKKFISFKDLTPQSFFKDHVNIDLGKFVSLVNDPRHEYNKLYTVEYLGNITEGRPVLYINLPVEELKRYSADAIKKGKSVWFGCDVGKFSNSQMGVMDLNLYDYKTAFGVSFNLNKADRLRYGESTMTHAMALCGIQFSSDNKPIRWCVENSWGVDEGDKGYFSMTDEWFSEYVYQVVIDEDALSEEQRKILKQKPIVLPPWDPLGTLA